MILFSRKENLAYAMQDRYTLPTSTTTKKQSLESKVEIHRETLTCRPRIKLNLDPHFNIKVGLNQHHLCISSNSRSKPHRIICWQWEPTMPTCQPFTCSGYEPSKTLSCMHYNHLHLHLVRNHVWQHIIWPSLTLLQKLKHQQLWGPSTLISTLVFSQLFLKVTRRSSSTLWKMQIVL